MVDNKHSGRLTSLAPKAERNPEESWARPAPETRSAPLGQSIFWKHRPVFPGRAGTTLRPMAVLHYLSWTTWISAGTNGVFADAHAVFADALRFC